MSNVRHIVTCGAGRASTWTWGFLGEATETAQKLQEGWPRTSEPKAIKAILLSAIDIYSLLILTNYWRTLLMNVCTCTQLDIYIYLNLKSREQREKHGFREFRGLFRFERN